mgnify:CR=1 FL=1
MMGKLRNMTAIYLRKDDNVLLLFRQGGKVVNEVWTGSAGGHFEEYELNDAKACVLREMKEELGLNENDIENLALRYVTLRKTNGEIRQNYYFFATLNREEELNSTEYSQSGDYYVLTVDGIKAQLLDDKYEFKVSATVNGSAKEATLSYGALSYCRSVLSKDYEQKLKDVVTALRLFNIAADQYIK